MSNIVNKLTSIEDFVIKQIRWIGGITAIVIVLLSLHDCKKSGDLSITQDELNQSFTQKKTDSNTIIQQHALLVLKEDAIVKKDEQIENLKNLKADVQYKTVTVIKNVLIPYHDTTHLEIARIDTINGVIDTVDCLPLPTTIDTIGKYFLIKETLTKNGAIIDSLSIPDSTTLVIGDSKKLFHPESLVIIKHTNPYVNTTSVSNIVVNDQIKKNELKSFGIGFGTGIGVAILTSILTGVLHK